MHNNTQANPQWFSQHQETARKSRQNPDLNCRKCFFSERFQNVNKNFRFLHHNRINALRYIAVENTVTR